MLTLKSLKWSNCFSYGDDNHIDFDTNSLTQLVGTNGTGKTSISLILQEILYGKNIKNIKKQDISNNKTGKKGYKAELTFEKDGDKYLVNLDRTSSLKFKLFKNSTDISSHTSLNTYKTLSDIIGVDDFKVFCQLIYQHSTDSLDFLTATDTNRKKFLISLLQLDKYMEYHEIFKDKARVLHSEVMKDEGAVASIEGWIKRHENMDFVKQTPIVIEPVDPEWYVKKSKYSENINNINSINRKIVTNQLYKKELDDLESKYYLGTAPSRPSPSSQELRARMRVEENNYNTLQTKINKILNVKGECPQCLQEVDLEEQERMANAEMIHRDMAKEQVAQLWDKITEAETIETEVKKFTKQKTEFERLTQLIDNSLDSQTLDLAEQKDKLSQISDSILQAENLVKSNERKNLEISAHNSKVDVVIGQLDSMRKDLKDKNIGLMEKENLSDILELLKKTFGTNGLVSYKIESSVKELEKKINVYLAELTHFQIYFKLSGEKLNIEVLDDVGNITSISNLSSGERARVNIATILAIRSILSSLTSTKINLLFLDEVIGVIDAEGKEKLSELLLQENLNTFIVSHDWSHPLIPKINIVKEHHISRIEDG
jgi:DNA repair exonuclease SbcCD ATPase subunit